MSADDTMKTQTAILGMILAATGGAGSALYLTQERIVEARQGEAQANGLESECKATLAQKETIRVKFAEQPSGDYRLFLYGSNRSLVCEEQDIHIIQQGDAVNPLILECQHAPYVREQ